MKRKMLYIFMVIIILLCGVSLVDEEVKKTEPDEIIYEAEEPVYVEYYENGIFTNGQDWVLTRALSFYAIFTIHIMERKLLDD